VTTTKPLTLASELVAAVQADPQLALYVTQNFGAGKVLKAFVGIDNEDQPQPDNPMLAIQIGSYVPAPDRTHRPVTLAFALVIDKSGDTVASNKTTLNGLTALEGLYLEVERVLESYIELNYHRLGDYGESRTEIAYPLFRISWDITFQGDY
jgi:hypothetical protein